MNTEARYTWSAQGAKWPMLNIVDWYAEGGPRVVASVPQTETGTGVEAAEAAVRLLESQP